MAKELENNTIENPSERLEEIDKEYVNIVNEAIQNDLNLDISNSTLNHAVFLAKKLISLSRSDIKIITGELNSPYYEEIRTELEEAASNLSKVKGKINILIWNKLESGNENFIQLQEKYRDTVEIKYANREDNINHFLVSDSKRYRFEELHSAKDLRDQNIKGKANFNNRETAESLNQSFESIWGDIK